jgi:molecular chaperone Hsp33
LIVNEVQSFLFEHHAIRGAVVRLTETWQQIVAQHRYPMPVQALLADSVAATVLLAKGLKDRPKVSLQLQGEGALRLLVIQCSADFKVRGMAQWRPFAEGDALLGEGRLSVYLDTGVRNGLFQGIVPLVSEHLDACLEAYFTQSEQLATRIVLAGDAASAAGLLVQAVPGRESDAETFANVAALAKAVSGRELIAAPADELLPRLFGDYMIRLFRPRAVLHDCRCTPEHLAGIARMLGADELHSLLDDQGKVELTCEFCNRAFRYDADGVAAILRGEAPGVAVH